MQFLTPIWFFALAALSIPLVIHLWNIKPGKTLKVGSISLISEASKTTRRSFKLLDILLLIVRCLLLVLLALLLATPVWQKITSAQKVKGWMLIPKEIFKETYQKFKPSIDSLDKAGYEFHYFNKGFARQELKTLLADTSIKDTTTTADYWGLVKQLANNAADVPVYIFTQNGIDHFKGSKPTVKLYALHWQTYTVKDSTDQWIAAAAFTNQNNIKVTDGRSSPHGISYTTNILKNGSDATHNILIQNGRTSVGLKNSNNAPVIVDTSDLRIAIYTDKYPLDANYLKAALSAATAFNGTKTTIKQYNHTTIPAGQTWLFWLSDQPVRSSLAQSTKHIFRYQGGKVSDVNSWIDPGHIALAKMINPASAQEAVWKDGFGKTVLGLNGHTYTFFSHFNPLWNNLVWSDDFPKLMLKLLITGRKPQLQVHERRILSNEQLQPNVVTQPTLRQAYATARQAGLSKYFWLMALALFTVERILSHQKNISNG